MPIIPLLPDETNESGSSRLTDAERNQTVGRIRRNPDDRYKRQDEPATVTRLEMKGEPTHIYSTFTEWIDTLLSYARRGPK